MRGEPRNELGRLLKHARLEKELTQQQVADAAGLAKSSYTMIEVGRVDRPSPEALRKIASVLDLSMHALIAATGQLDPPPPNDQDMERVEAEILRIAQIPGLEAKMQALMQLSPALYDFVAAAVVDLTAEDSTPPALLALLRRRFLQWDRNKK